MFQNLSKQNKIIAIICILAVIDVFTQYTSKLYTIQKDKLLLFVMIIGYVCMGLLTHKLTEMKKLTVAYTLHLLSHFIVLGVIFFISKLIFHEKYSTMEMIGLLFGVISMYILTFKN